MAGRPMVLIGSLRGVKTATQVPTQFVPWKGRGQLGLMVYEATEKKKKKKPHSHKNIAW